MDAPQESTNIALVIETILFVIGWVYLSSKSEEILEDAREAGGTGKWIVYLIIYPVLIISNILTLVGIHTAATMVRDWWHKNDRNNR